MTGALATPTDETSQATVSGIVKFVSLKTHGIILVDDPDTWWNPEPHLHDRVNETLKGQYVTLVLTHEGSTRVSGLKINEGTKVIQGSALGSTLARKAADVKAQVKDGTYGQPVPSTHITPAQAEREKGTGIEFARKHGHIMNFRGNDYITYKGLLDIATEKGIRSTDTDLKSVDYANHCAVVKAVVIMQDGKVYSALGDATPENMQNKTIWPHFIRMAETRALARALRQATNVGMTSIEELEIGEPAKDDQKPGHASAKNT